MTTPYKNLLLTGPPGCGKTTVIRRVIEGAGDCRLAGFYTEEIRGQGGRVGFRAIGLRGTSTVLAHVDFHGPARVGKYGLDLAAFEDLVRRELGEAEGAAGAIVIDEIGKMECQSKLFVEVAARVLDGPVMVLATIAARGGGFIEQARHRTDVEIMPVSPGNRDGLPDLIVPRLRGGRGLARRMPNVVPKTVGG